MKLSSGTLAILWVIVAVIANVTGIIILHLVALALFIAAVYTYFAKERNKQ